MEWRLLHHPYRRLVVLALTLDHPLSLCVRPRSNEHVEDTEDRSEQA